MLPILESLINGPAKSSRKTGYGRPPSVLVLLPTRELANQVHQSGLILKYVTCVSMQPMRYGVIYIFSLIQVYNDFEVYGGAVGLSSCCVYGGTPYHGQELKLKRGVDIVVGAPGRVKVCFLLLVLLYYKYCI